MNRLLLIVSIALALVLTACATPQRGAADVSMPAAQPEDPLVRQLANGGYVVVFRHGKTEQAFQDKLDKPGWWKSCDTRSSRVLSDEGRAQMLAIGDNMRALRIPVAQVVASEYCRAFDSGLLLQLMPVAQSAMLNFPDAQRTLGRSDMQITADLRVLFSTPPPARSNIILIGHVHGFNPPIDPVFQQLQEAEAAVLRPTGEGKFEIVGRITADKWALRVK